MNFSRNTTFTIVPNRYSEQTCGLRNFLLFLSKNRRGWKIPPTHKIGSLHRRSDKPKSHLFLFRKMKGPSKSKFHEGTVEIKVVEFWKISKCQISPFHYQRSGCFRYNTSSSRTTSISVRESTEFRNGSVISEFRTFLNWYWRSHTLNCEPSGILLKELFKFTKWNFVKGSLKSRSLLKEPSKNHWKKYKCQINIAKSICKARAPCVCVCMWEYKKSNNAHHK